MKTLSVPLLAHYALPTTQIAEGWRVTRMDAEVFGWTTHDRDVTIDGVLYRASEGLAPTSAHTTNTLSTDTMDVTAFLDITTEADIAAGLWDESTVIHFEFIWASPPATLDDNVLIKRCGTLGRIHRQDLVFTAEIRGLADALQTRIGRQYSPVCPWRHAVWNGTTFVASVECQTDLASHIHDGSITAVGDDATLMFSDTASTQADGYYDTGFVSMTSGANEGLTREVLMWVSDTFTLLRPFPYLIEVGDTYRAVRGDAHDFATCKDVYDNVVNFGGFPHVPGFDQVYSTPVGV